MVSHLMGLMDSRDIYTDVFNPSSCARKRRSRNIEKLTKSLDLYRLDSVCFRLYSGRLGKGHKPGAAILRRADISQVSPPTDPDFNEDMNQALELVERWDNDYNIARENNNLTAEEDFMRFIGLG